MIKTNGKTTSIFTEIAKPKQSMDTLQESDEKYRMLYDNSSDAIMMLDDKGFFDCNNETLRIFGYLKKEDFIKIHPADISPPYQPDGVDSYTASNNNIAQAFKNGTNHFEWVHRRQNGNDFPADVLLTAFKLKGRQVLQATVRDITKPKQAQEKLQISEARYRALVEWMPEAIAIHRDGKLIYVNPAAIKMIGAESAQDLIGKPLLDLVHPDFHQIVLDRVKNTTDLGIDMPILEEKFIKLDGTVIDVEVKSISIVYDGEPANYVAAHDITEHKRAENVIHKLNTELEQRVLERTAELKEKNDELERFNEIFVGREFRMIELKEQMAELEAEIKSLKNETTV